MPKVSASRRRIGVAVASVLAATLAAIVDAPAPAGAATAGVAVVDNAYEPATVRITAGDTVRWEHQGSAPHSVTADDGRFDSHPGCGFPGITGCMSNGETFEHTFAQPGTYAYYCRIHGGPGGSGMAGVVEVVAPSPPPPPPAPTTPPAPPTTSASSTPRPTTTTTAPVASPTTTPSTTSTTVGLLPSTIAPGGGAGTGTPSSVPEEVAAAPIRSVEGPAWVAGILVLLTAVWFTVSSWLLSRRQPTA